MAIPGRQYGLILPKKTQQLHRVLQKPSVFGNDSDDDDETSVSESLQREAAKKQAMKQTKLEIQKALEEDSTVYEYDSIYDEMQKKKEENNPKLLLGKDRKPKYIHNLLKAVEIRKKEQEKRMEKKIQREREMEKGEFDDKESFVTSAYKKKLQERAEEEEREKRAAALEACLDVTKQKDLSGFYRHLLNQAVGEEEVPKCSFREARSEIKEEKARGYSDEVNSENRIPQQNCILQTGVKDEENPDADSDFDSKSSEEDEMEENKVNYRKEKVTETSKNYSKHHRNQTHSHSSSEERGHGAKHHTTSSKSRGHEKSGDQHPVRQCRDQENHCSDQDHRKEKDSYRHRDTNHRDSHWKRQEHEDKLRRRDHREKSDREWQREKCSREQERDRQRNDHERHSEKGEKEEKAKKKEDGIKGKKERYEQIDKYRDREKREVNESSERNRDRKESSPNVRAKDEFLDQQKSNKMKDREKDEERNQEKPISSSEMSLGTKHRLTEERQEKDKEEETLKAVSKFAKRNNEETLMSARDRYLARQMARINAKTYIEKEED